MMRDFQTSHMKAFQLEQAIQDERFNFITEYVNDSPSTTCEDDSYEVNSSYNESICTEQSFQTARTATTVMSRISGKDQSGYKYGGKGFDVFTGSKNQCKPIY